MSVRMAQANVKCNPDTISYFRALHFNGSFQRMNNTEQ